MKTILALFVVFSLVSAGCDKEERMESQLQGAWELRHIKGGQIAGVSPDYPPGNGNLVKIDGEMIEFLSSGGSTNAKFKFVVESDNQEIDGVKFKYKIVREQADRPQLDYYFKLNGNTLLLSLGSIASDGTTSTYVRQ